MTRENKFYQPEFIELYAREQCSPEESKAMAELLLNDVNLREQVNLQKDILTAIAESRKQDLKKVLQNTPIPAKKPLFTKPLVQIAATFVGILALITLWTLNQPEKGKTKVAPQQNKQAVPIRKTEEKRIVETPSPKTTPEVTSEKTSERISEKRVLPKKEHKEEKNTPFIREIHYQYDGNTFLQLFGDFRYELIEKVDVGAGEKTYIYVQNQFYELIPTASDEIRNLKESIVTNKEQIKLLAEKLMKK